jgi:hypothetical protein
VLGDGSWYACLCGTGAVVPVVVVVPEHSPGSFTAGAERGHLGPGRAHASSGGAMHTLRGEQAWRAAAAFLGLTLHEAAVLAHGAKEAWGQMHHALRRACLSLAFLGLLVWPIRPLLPPRRRCATCGRRLPTGGAAAHCDRCAAACLPALRLKVAQLEAQAEEDTLALADACYRAHLAEREKEQAQRQAHNQELRAEAAEARARELAAELEALGSALEERQP